MNTISRINSKSLVCRVFFAKIIAIAAFVLSGFNLQAQEIEWKWEDITNKFKWEISPDIEVRANSNDLLQVENRNAVSKAIKKSRKIDFSALKLDINLKEPGGLHLELNQDNDPAKYNFYVYKRDKKGNYKKKGELYKDNIYWGTYLEMYSQDGSIVTDEVWISAKTKTWDAEAGAYSPFVYNVNNVGWEKLYINATLSTDKAIAGILPTNIVLFPDKTLIVNGNNDAEKRVYADIVGIKDMYIYIGTAAKVTMKNFTVARLVPEFKANGGWLGNGTGFFVDKRGYIATNYHVVEKAKRIEVEFIRKGKRQVHEASVVKADKKNDLAILKIKGKFYPFSDIPYNFRVPPVDVGTSVFALGYPMALNTLGKEIKFTDGKVSSRTGFKGDATKYQISVPIQPGNSGGPLFDYNGNLIGVTSSTVDRRLGVENVNYAIKAAYLRNLIASLPVKLNMPNNSSIAKRSLTDKIKILSDYVVLVKVK